MVKEQILNEIERLLENGLQNDLFEAAKKPAYGERLVAFDKVEGEVSCMVESAVTGDGVFAEIEALQSVTINDVADCLKLLTKDNYALSVITPNANK